MRHAIPAAALVFLAGCSGPDNGAAPAGKTSYPWSLDLNLSGDAVFTGLTRDTSAVAAVQGEISGRVNGYDSAVIEDTLRFVNDTYEGFTVSAPLDPDGTFRFDAFDLLGGLDGSMTLRIRVRARSEEHVPDPDTLALQLERP